MNRDEWRNPNTWLVSIEELESVLRSKNINFLSNVPEDIRKYIKERIYLLPPTASLLADTELTSDSRDTIWVNNDAAIWHSSIAEEGTSHYGEKEELSSSHVSSGQVKTSHLEAIQVSVPQVGITQVSPIQNSTTQISAPEIDFSQTGLFQVGITEVGVGQISLSQGNSTQIGISQISMVQNNIIENFLTSSVAPEKVLGTNNPYGIIFKTPIWHSGITEESSFQNSGTQVGTTEIGINQIGTTQFSASQVGIGQIGTHQIGTTQVGISQVDTYQIGINQVSTIEPSPF
nr:hypothetical protein [Nostoc sp. ChiSLP03a]